MVLHFVKTALINITIANMNTINYESLSKLQGFLHPDVKIVDIEVKGKWLTATLSSGVIFSVKN